MIVAKVLTSSVESIQNRRLIAEAENYTKRSGGWQRGKEKTEIDMKIVTSVSISSALWLICRALNESS